MQLKWIIVSALGVMTLSCAAPEKESFKANIPESYPKGFWLEGHRGARGLSPENTIPSMKTAIDHGANFIEVDIYITKDGQALIAHDPYPNIQHTLFEDGSEITAEQAKQYVWRQMNYEDIRKFDVGSKPFPAYPEQVNIKTYMPLLGELIDSIEAYTAEKNITPVIYNIEVKTSIYYDTLNYNAGPEEMIDRVMEVVRSKNIGDRFYIQSFDKRPLQYAKKKYPEVTLGFLTGDKKISMSEHIAELGFLPDIYAPSHTITTKELIDSVHQQGMKFVPWTVNAVEDMVRLIEWGTDGIITDYANRLDSIVNKK